MQNSKEITRDIIAVLLVGATIASLFVSVSTGSETVVRTLTAAVIGYYFGGAVTGGLLSLGSTKVKTTRKKK